MSSQPTDTDELESLTAQVVDANVNVDEAPSESAALALGDTKPDVNAIARRDDPLALYMRDVNRYSLLSTAEEKALAVKYFDDGDLDAARELVTANLRLVVKIAYNYRQAYKNLLDLVQEGNIGLMQAVKKYDPYKGVKLSSYAAWWIRAYMLRFILNNHRLVKVGTTQAQRKLFFNLQKEKARLGAMGIEATADVIAKNLKVPEKDVVSMDMRLSSGDASLDVPVGTSDGRSVSTGGAYAFQPDARSTTCLQTRNSKTISKRRFTNLALSLKGKKRSSSIAGCSLKIRKRFKCSAMDLV